MRSRSETIKIKIGDIETLVFNIDPDASHEDVLFAARQAYDEKLKKLSPEKSIHNIAYTITNKKLTEEQKQHVLSGSCIFFEKCPNKEGLTRTNARQSFFGNESYWFMHYKKGYEVVCEHLNDADKESKIRGIHDPNVHKELDVFAVKNEDHINTLNNITKNLIIASNQKYAAEHQKEKERLDQALNIVQDEECFTRVYRPEYDKKQKEKKSTITYIYNKIQSKDEAAVSGKLKSLSSDEERFEVITNKEFVLSASGRSSSTSRSSHQKKEQKNALLNVVIDNQPQFLSLFVNSFTEPTYKEKFFRHPIVGEESDGDNCLLDVAAAKYLGKDSQYNVSILKNILQLAPEQQCFDVLKGSAGNSENPLLIDIYIKTGVDTVLQFITLVGNEKRCELIEQAVYFSTRNSSFATEIETARNSEAGKTLLDCMIERFDAIGFSRLISEVTGLISPSIIQKIKNNTVFYNKLEKPAKRAICEEYLTVIKAEAESQKASTFSKAFATFSKPGCFYYKRSLVQHIRDNLINSNDPKKLDRAFNILSAYASGNQATLEKVLKTNIDGKEGKNTTSFKLFDFAYKNLPRDSAAALPSTESPQPPSPK